MTAPDPPVLRLSDGEAALSGAWTLAEFDILGRRRRLLFQALSQAGSEARSWNLEGISRLDNAAALLLWRAWRQRYPKQIILPERLAAAFSRIARLPEQKEESARPVPFLWLERLGRSVLSMSRRMLSFTLDVTELLGALVLSAYFLCRHPKAMPWKEFSATLYKAGFEAMPVTLLVGFLIGLTISYLSALQLRLYGADIFVVNLLGMGIIRELGPVLAAVLVAGRSGSAMTAQIGVMRVTEEIDALAVMGVSATLRVVWPKVAAMLVVMPLLVVWVSFSALLGGAVAAFVELELSIPYFFLRLPEVVAFSNLWIGLSKGAVFGFLIALLACHFGLKVRPNTESLSRHTTASVVTAITLVILTDAIFALLTRQIGI